MNTATAIIASQQGDVQRLQAALITSWVAYQESDAKRTAKGFDFGKACYELRDHTRAQGSRTGGGFETALKKLGIPKPTAYRWISRYAETAGLRLTRDEVAGGSLPELDEVQGDYLPGLCDDTAIVGSHAGVLVFIEPSTVPSFFFVTCMATDDILEGTGKPIRKDAVPWVISELLRYVPGHHRPEAFDWVTRQLKARDHNYWLEGTTA